MGLYEALSWINDLGLQHVIFEIDAKVVHDYISSTNSESVFGDFISGCKRIPEQNNSFYVCLARRTANLVAHRIFRTSYSVESPHY